MARVSTLITTGLSRRAAQKLGYVIEGVTGAGTTQGAAAAIGEFTLVNLTTASSQTGAILPGNVEPGYDVTIYVESATTGVVYPETGGTIQGGATNAGFSIEQNRTVAFVRVAALTWKAIGVNVAGVVYVTASELAAAVEVSAINAQTDTAHTLVIGDRGQTITMDNASANVVTIPLNSSVDFDVGTVIHILQKGAGVTTITAATNVALNGVSSDGSGAINHRYGGVSLLQTANDVWIASGDIATVA